MQINSDMDQIDILNNNLLPSVAKDYPIGLVTGKLGMCIREFAG